MKIILLSFTILIIQNVNAQDALVTKSQPPKKSTKIIVLVKDTANTLLDRISGALYERGYSIESKDEKVKFLSTKERQGKRWSTYYKVRAKISDTAIVFTGQISLRHDRDYWDIDYSGSKISALREAWNELYAIAKLFGDNIIYSK